MRSPNTPTIRVLTTPHAPIAAIIARYPLHVQPKNTQAPSPSAVPQRWSHVLKWNLRTGTLTPGAWTSLHLKPTDCFLSDDGTYLKYTATGPLDGPFSKSEGGATTISVLPFLAALTDITDHSPLHGSIPGKHALHPTKQAALHALFENPPNPTPSISPELLSKLNIPDLPPNPHATLTTIPCSNFQLATVQPTPNHILSSNFYLVTRDPPHTAIPLPTITWATPASANTLAAATNSGHLQLLTIAADGTISTAQSHDLTTLTPNPTPPPHSATIPSTQ